MTTKTFHTTAAGEKYRSGLLEVFKALQFINGTQTCLCIAQVLHAAGLLVDSVLHLLQDRHV